MRVPAKVLIYTAAVVVLSALLAPLLWWLGQWAIDSDLLPMIRRYRFAKYFNRAVMLVALATLWPFLRWLGIKHWTELSLQPNPRRWRDLLTGISLGLVGLSVVAAVLMLTGVAVWRDKIRWLQVAGAFATALLVPLIEEPIFRGAIFGMLRKTMPWKTALIVLSFFFAILHFVRSPPGSQRITEVHWYSGFELLTKIFWQFGHLDRVVGGRATLFVFSLLLGYIVVRTRSLYMAIGLHGGSVLALRIFYFVSKRPGGATIWVGKELTEGLVPLLLLTATLGFVVWLLRDRPRTPEVEESS